MTRPSDPLELRLRRLERTNRALAMTLLVVAALASAAALRQEPPAEVLRARQLQLVDERGTVRAELAVRDGSAGLFVSAASGEERIQLMHDDEATGLFLKDATGVVRVGAAQFAHGGGGFALHGPESKGGAVLFLKNTGSLRFFDAEGKVTNSVRAHPE